MQITTKHQQLQPIQPILQLVKQVVSTNASQGLVFTTNLANFFGQIKKRAKKLVIQVVCTNAPQGLVFTTDLTQFLAKSKKRQIIELQERIKLLLSPTAKLFQEAMFFTSSSLSLRPESSENIPILFQGADLYFSNQNDLRNPKMGSKQSVVVATERRFFQITFLGTKNHQKNRTVSLLIHSHMI